MALMQLACGIAWEVQISSMLAIKLFFVLGSGGPHFPPDNAPYILNGV